MNYLYRDKQWLGKEYLELKKSAHTIAKENGCKPATIYKWLCINKIERRKSSDYIHPKGEFCPNWKGGFYINKSGYKLNLAPNHRLADSKGYVYEHMLVVEKHLGRSLSKDEQVHHINHKTADNRIGNLMVFPSRTAHSDFEKTERRKQWEEHGKICTLCGELKYKNDFLKNWKCCLSCERKRHTKWRILNRDHLRKYYSDKRQS